MNTKELIASELASVIDSLDQEAILNLLETPKNSQMVDLDCLITDFLEICDKLSPITVERRWPIENGLAILGLDMSITTFSCLPIC